MVGCVLMPLKCCLGEERQKFWKDMIVFGSLYILTTYGLIVAALICLFAATGGISDANICIHDDFKSWLSLIWLECAPIVSVIGGIYKCCMKVKENSGKMELKDEYKN